MYIHVPIHTNVLHAGAFCTGFVYMECGLCVTFHCDVAG